MNSVKVGFANYHVNFICDCTYVLLMILLSIYGGMALHICIAQMNFEWGHEWCLYDVMFIVLNHLRYNL